MLTHGTTSVLFKGLLGSSRRGLPKQNLLFYARYPNSESAEWDEETLWDENADWLYYALPVSCYAAVGMGFWFSDETTPIPKTAAEILAWIGINQPWGFVFFSLRRGLCVFGQETPFSVMRKVWKYMLGQSSLWYSNQYTSIPLPTYYIDEVNGVDTNDGLTPYTPFASLSRLEDFTLLPSVKIGIARGGYYQENVRVTVDNASIYSYGRGPIPVIDCADGIDNSEWDKEITLTNTYKIYWPVTTSLQSAKTAGKAKMVCTAGSTIRDAQILADVFAVNASYTQAQVDTMAGSYFYNWTTNVLYIHPIDSGDPEVGSLVYAASTREFSCESRGTNSQIVGVETRRNGHSDGSLVIGDGSLKSCIMAQGHVHNALSGSLIAEDCFFINPRKTASTSEGVMLVLYNSNLSGKTGILTRCFFIDDSDGGATSNVSGLYAHGQSGGDELDSFIASEVCFADLLNPGGPKSKVFQLSNSYLKDVGGIPVGYPGLGTTYTEHSTVIDTCFVKFTKNLQAVRPVGFSYKLKNSCFFWQSVRAFLQYYTTGLNIDIDSISIYIASGPGGFQDGGFFPSSIKVNRMIIAGANATGLYHLLVKDGTTYIGDYNIFCRTEFSPFIAQWHGATVSTLSSWQSLSGQDSNSVYLTAAQFTTFWLGNPSEGDFRINPSAQVTAGNGTVYTGVFPDGTPITSAGAQQHFDWETMSVKSGPPTHWPDAHIPRTLEEIEMYLA